MTDKIKLGLAFLCIVAGIAGYYSVLRLQQGSMG
jgi:hypothetical protein